ncbi:MAG: transposase [Desulfobacteraceae bacterium]|nr:transposase [Desulfobacteraceae bacterium]
MNALVAVSQVAKSMNIGTKAVRLQAVKDNWPVIKKQKQGGSELLFPRDLLPVKIQAGLVVMESVTGNTNLPVIVRDTPVPKKSNKIGMAKYNLVHAHRLAKEQAPWGEKKRSAQEFLLAYNAGLLLPQVFSVIGEIQVKTIESLDKKLRNNNDDYHALCDGRGGWKKHGSNKYKGRKLSEAAKAIFLKCYLHGSRPSVIMAIRAAKMTLEKENMADSVNETTYRRWLKDYTKYNAGIICLARDGMKAYIDNYGPYISRDASLLKVGQCLVADGKTLNFFIKHPDTGRNCRMTLIVFFDWASRYPVGWQILPTENQWGILAAFRNAVQTLGRYPDSVYLDNGRAFKSKLFAKEVDLDFEEMTGLYARVGTAVMFAKPYNGRSKVVERFFKTVQDQLEFMMPSYCGDSITTKPPWMSRNEKFQKAWHEARTQGWVPTIREAAVIIDRYFQWYSQQPQKDLPAPPEDMFLPNRGPGVDQHQLNYDFLWRKKVHPRKCRISLWNIDYESDCLHNLSTKEPIRAMVDTADLSKIWCYTMDGIYLGEAYPVQACHPLARLFGDQVSVEQVTYQNKRQARLAKNTKKQLEDLGVTKRAPDSLNVLAFAATKEKTAILPGDDSSPVRQESKLLSQKETKRLELIMEKAEQDAASLPEIPRPKYWDSSLKHYEWCFRFVHEHGRKLELEDSQFVKEFESLPEFKNYRQRFEDLKLVFQN